MIRVQTEILNVEAELAALRDRNKGYGALASFTGYVRDEGGDVSELCLEHYPGFTEKTIEAFDGKARQMFDVTDTLIIHRVGPMVPSDAIVLVAALAAHRKPAIKAVDYLMDFLKTDAPFWKKEQQNGQSNWIEPKTHDYDSTANWRKKDD